MARPVRWAFRNGESHTEMEDAILDRIEMEQAAERGLQELGEWWTGGEQKPRRLSVRELRRGKAA